MSPKHILLVSGYTDKKKSVIPLNFYDLALWYQLNYESPIHLNAGVVFNLLWPARNHCDSESRCMKYQYDQLHANEQQGSVIPMQSAAWRKAGQSDDESIPRE